MLKFLPIFLFFHSPISHLFFLLFNPFFFSMYLFFLNVLAETQFFFHNYIYVHLTNEILLLDTRLELCLLIVNLGNLI